MRIITKRQEREIFERIYANHLITNAEIKNTESLMHYVDNEVKIVGNALGPRGLNAMLNLIEQELLNKEDKE